MNEKPESSTILTKKQRERQWKRGEHTNSDGEVFDLETIDIKHLRNVIAMFEKQRHNVRPLKDALAKREAREYVESVGRVLEFLKKMTRAMASEKGRRSARKAHKSLSTFWGRFPGLRT